MLRLLVSIFVLPILCCGMLVKMLGILLAGIGEVLDTVAQAAIDFCEGVVDTCIKR